MDIMEAYIKSTCANQGIRFFRNIMNWEKQIPENSIITAECDVP